MKNLFIDENILPRLHGGEDILEPGEIVTIAKNIKKLEHRALFILEYLTGGRVGEIVSNKGKYGSEFGVRKKQFKLNEIGGKDYLFINDVYVLKKYEFIRNPNFDPRKDHPRDKFMKNLDCNTWQTKRKFEKKVIPIPIHKEKELVDMLNEYLNNLGYSNYLFDKTRQWAHKVISSILLVVKPHSTLNKMLNANHYFRHVRTTHLITEYKLSESHIVKLMKWSNSEQLHRTYSHLFGDDLARAMG